MDQNEHIMTVTTMEYTSKTSGNRCLGQVIQIGVLQEDVEFSDLEKYTSLPTGFQVTHRDAAMAVEHGDLGLEVREENIPLVIPHFGPDPLRGFGSMLELSDPSLRPWPQDLPLYFRELVYGAETIRSWFTDRQGIYPHIHRQLTEALATCSLGV